MTLHLQILSLTSGWGNFWLGPTSCFWAHFWSGPTLGFGPTSSLGPRLYELYLYKHACYNFVNIQFTLTHRSPNTCGILLHMVV